MMIKFEDPTIDRAILVLKMLEREEKKLLDRLCDQTRESKSYMQGVIAGYVKAQYVILGINDRTSSWFLEAEQLIKEREDDNARKNQSN